MIDCDIYSSARTALGFCAPLIQNWAVVLFDDWNSGGLAAKGLGERGAFEEFMAGNPDLQAKELEIPTRMQGFPRHADCVDEGTAAG